MLVLKLYNKKLFFGPGADQICAVFTLVYQIIGCHDNLPWTNITLANSLSSRKIRYLFQYYFSVANYVTQLSLNHEIENLKKVIISPV